MSLCEIKITVLGMYFSGPVLWQLCVAGGESNYFMAGNNNLIPRRKKLFAFVND